MEETTFKIVCPFCNAPYTGDMEDLLYASQGCDTCGPIISGSIEIKCSNCRKIVYKKEY